MISGLQGAHLVLQPCRGSHSNHPHFLNYRLSQKSNHSPTNCNFFLYLGQYYNNPKYRYLKFGYEL